MSDHLSSLLGAALGTPETSRPAASDTPPQPPYGSPADVAQRIEQYLARDGRMNSRSQLMYEAMKALRALDPAAGDAQIAAYTLPEAIRVERAAQTDGGFLWAVRRDGDCLGRNGKWSYEPLPSSRSDTWLALHRFVTATAAIDAALAALQAEGAE